MDDDGDHSDNNEQDQDSAEGDRKGHQRVDVTESRLERQERIAYELERRMGQMDDLVHRSTRQREAKSRYGMYGGFNGSTRGKRIQGANGSMRDDMGKGIPREKYVNMRQSRRRQEL